MNHKLQTLLETVIIHPAISIPRLKRLGLTLLYALTLFTRFPRGKLCFTIAPPTWKHRFLYIISVPRFNMNPHGKGRECQLIGGRGLSRGVLYVAETKEKVGDEYRCDTV